MLQVLLQNDRQAEFCNSNPSCKVSLEACKIAMLRKTAGRLAK